MKVICQAIVLYAQLLQGALDVLIDALEPDETDMAVETVEPDLAETAQTVVTEALGRTITVGPPPPPSDVPQVTITTGLWGWGSD